MHNKSETAAQKQESIRNNGYNARHDTLVASNNISGM